MKGLISILLCTIFVIFDKAVMCQNLGIDTTSKVIKLTVAEQLPKNFKIGKYISFVERVNGILPELSEVENIAFKANNDTVLSVRNSLKVAYFKFVIENTNPIAGQTHENLKSI